MNKKHKQIALASAKVAGVIALLGGSFAAGAYTIPREVEVIKTVEKEVLVPSEPVIQTVEKIVEKTVEVKVDNGNLDLVLRELVDKNGNVEYLTDGLDDDEIEFVVERLLIKNEWEAIALNKTRSELYDELDKEVVDGTELDEDDLRSLIIETEDILFENIDWDDKDAEVVLTAKFRQEDEKFQATVRVFIRENEFDELVVESVERR